MARGWESKSVESQQSETLSTRARRRDEPSPDELERMRKRDSLDLSRRRVVSELRTSKSAVHRSALENALRFLDEELARLR